MRPLVELNQKAPGKIFETGTSKLASQPSPLNQSVISNNNNRSSNPFDDAYPVDINAFHRLKEQKNQNKQMIAVWYSEFQRKNNRKPTD